MKRRKLTASEAEISIVLDDIYKIDYDMFPPLPFNTEALEAMETGLSIRESFMNIFLVGPTRKERIQLIESSLKYLCPGELSSFILKRNEKGEYIYSIEKKQNDTVSNDERLLLNKNSKAPVFYEKNPTKKRLFGKDSSSFDKIKVGSLLKSNGGIIIINAGDLIEEKNSWKQLKRTLRNGKILLGTNGLFTSPVEVDLKVIIEGTEDQYDFFYNNFSDFRELFQVFVEIDSEIDLNQINLKNTVNNLRNYSRNKLKMELTNSAVLELIKHSISTTENKMKLSAVLSDLEIIITEAAEYKRKQNCHEIIDKDISRIIENQSARFSLIEQQIIKEIQSGEIDIHVEGSEIGKVNGLAVIDKGPWAFGTTGLISATIAPGENGLVNIEHEAGLSGEIHDKWVLILEAFLRSRFAQDFSISIFASICFEQSYSPIDGDSASSAELYALLSAIAKTPLRQDIAVTGSLSQTGEIQAVGGLREKIEGFHKLCKKINFTGRQGVIIPERNIGNILLPDDIIEDIRNENFFIYPVSSVNQSMEILTGKKAGEKNRLGQFPPDTLNYLIEKNLKKISAQAKNAAD